MALREALSAGGLDAILVQHLPNIRYLTGFTGSAGLLLMTPDATVLYTDFRYAVQAPQEVGGSARVEIDRTSVWERVKRALAADPVDRLAVESHVATSQDLERLAEAHLRITPVAELVERFRASKSPEEVAAIRSAGALAESALAATLPLIHAGQTEFEVAAELEAALRRRGSEWHPFPTIVASGPRSALPHARTSGRRIEKGDWLLLDFGAQVDGYCADLSRTFVVGAAPDDRQQMIYDVVRAAQRRAMDLVRAGMSGKEADALARDTIAGHGFGDAFGHSLGHGLGLEVHEAPRLAATADSPLPLHAVVTVEPGAYFPGWGGVRLEDDVYLGPDGPEPLTGGPGTLTVLGA